MVGMSYIYNNIIIFADKVFKFCKHMMYKIKEILFTVALLQTI